MGGGSRGSEEMVMHTSVRGLCTEQNLRAGMYSQTRISTPVYIFVMNIRSIKSLRGIESRLFKADEEVVRRTSQSYFSAQQYNNLQYLEP